MHSVEPSLWGSYTVAETDRFLSKDLREAEKLYWDFEEVILS